MFFNNKNIGRLTKNDIESFRVYRNDVMHHHTICEEKFKIIQKDIEKANQSLRFAINEIESKIYTQEEYGTVFSLSGNIITGIISTFNRIFDIKALDISNAIGETLENLSKNMANIIPNITKAMNNAMQMIASPPKIPDYSKLLENVIKPIQVPDYSKLLEDVIKPIQVPDYSELLENVIKPIQIPDYSELVKNFDKPIEIPDYSKFSENLTEPPAITAYSKSFDSSTIQHDSQDDQQDIENHSESSS